MLAQKAGSIDSSFGKNGVVFTAETGSARTLLLQKSGKIIAVGAGNIIRYNINGRIYKSFAIDGIVETGWGFGGGYPIAALQADDKIIILGGGGGSTNYVIMRYGKNGIIDSTFGTNGYATYYYKDKRLYPEAIAIQPDGKIAVAGNVRYTPEGSGEIGVFGVARNNADGSPDTSFGKDGSVIFKITDPVNQFYAIAVQPDNKIIAGGHASVPTNDFVLTRLNYDGSFDSSFGTNGSVTTDFCRNEDQVNAITIQEDGKIIACGEEQCINSSRYNFAIVRYLPNGDLDSSFASDGKDTADFGGDYDIARAVAITRSNEIIVAGYSTLNEFDERAGNFALIKYTQQGKPDKAFGNKGKVITDHNNTRNNGYAVVIQPDGKIIVGGSTVMHEQSGITLVRYHDEDITGNKHNYVVRNTEYELSPNPVHNIFQIFHLNEKAHTVINVLNQNGQLLSTNTTRASSYLQNIQHLKEGIYFVQIISDSKIVSLKMIKE
jgi:uncharacterized delta-60 repeat protein